MTQANRCKEASLSLQQKKKLRLQGVTPLERKWVSPRKRRKPNKEVQAVPQSTRQLRSQGRRKSKRLMGQMARQRPVEEQHHQQPKKKTKWSKETVKPVARDAVSLQRTHSEDNRHETNGLKSQVESVEANESSSQEASAVYYEQQRVEERLVQDEKTSCPLQQAGAMDSMLNYVPSPWALELHLLRMQHYLYTPPLFHYYPPSLSYFTAPTTAVPHIVPQVPLPMLFQTEQPYFPYQMPWTRQAPPTIVSPLQVPRQQQQTEVSITLAHLSSGHPGEANKRKDPIVPQNTQRSTIDQTGESQQQQEEPPNRPKRQSLGDLSKESRSMLRRIILGR